MRKIVEEGYEKGDYAGTFRISDKPNEMEEGFLKKLIKLLPKNPHILDFGCGIGVPFDKYLDDHGCKVTGIDISQKHINEAKKNVHNAKFIKGDFSKTDFQETFDAIISFYAIFHIPREEHKELFLNMADLLKKEGKILITLGTSGSYGEEENWCGAKMVWSTYKPEMYKKLLDETGFKILEATFEGKQGDKEYHFWVLAQKK
ncbi:MAG: class I SAM-dependent methyltransferase [bacterium]|nr:class I SAM-dependent methyltransferase [bacterium]